MSEGADVDRYLQNPNQLLELSREVIERLHGGANSAVVKEGESQLREISKAIERLERAGVAVPDVLRGEKTQLIASLAMTAEAAAALGRLIDEFQDLLNEMKERLGLKPPVPPAKPKSKVKNKRSRSAKTSRQELRQQIIRALKKLGGKAPAADVIKEIGKQLDGKLLPGDAEWRAATKDHAWENNAKWERYRMTQEGIMRTGSPRGIWELSKDEK